MIIVEDDKLTWVDDILWNTYLCKAVKKVTESSVPSYFLPRF